MKVNLVNAIKNFRKLLVNFCTELSSIVQTDNLPPEISFKFYMVCLKENFLTVIWASIVNHHTTGGFVTNQEFN